jgi:hypothetical protein
MVYNSNDVLGRSGGFAVTDGAAAAAAERRRLQEEEEMTTYSQEELQAWEFKIVRANTSIFGKSAEFNKLIQEEAQSGWIMVEKFDNSRVRFKRPVSAREKDAQLPTGIDPYRTHYGMSTVLFVFLVIIITLVGTCILMALIFAIIGLLGAGFSAFPFLIR